MAMTCEQVLESIEAVAAGDEPADAAFDAHLAGCPSCAAALATARAIERTLASSPAVGAPERFSQSVLARIRRDRWREEQQVDRAFHAAIGIAIVAMLAAAVSLWNLSGVVRLVLLAIETMSEVSQASAEPGTNHPILALGLPAALFATALAVWWWAERRSPYDAGGDGGAQA